jgi:hypothetical protein
MADLRAQRTLVKSPPELWAELSNLDSLARRLSDFGEIRITRLVPEKTVAWEGERASGTVELESSGWGTRVRLTASPRDAVPTSPVAAIDRVTAVIDEDDGAELEATAPDSPRRDSAVRDSDAPESPVPEPVASRRSEAAPHLRAGRGEAAATPTPTRSAPPTRPSRAAERSAARTASRAAAAPFAAAPPPASRQSPPMPAPPDLPPAAPPAAPPARRPGFFARLFGRRQANRSAASAPTPAAPPPPPPAGEATTAPTPAPSLAQPRPQPARGAPAVPRSTRPRPDEAARYPPPMPAPPPALDPEQTMAVLSSVLDDLGAAHHRPFSRE